MNEKKREKKSMLIALLVALIMVSSAFIGTFAKYIALNTATDSAEVAKFVFNVPASIDLFAEDYDNVSSDADGKKIIAPGTSGQSSFVVTGTSEVAYQVAADISVIYSANWNGHAPLRFSLNGTDWTSLEDFQTNLSVALSSETMEPNSAYANTKTIYWQWPFYVSAEDDIKDTAVGTLAADSTAPTVTVNIDVTATQVD